MTNYNPPVKPKEIRPNRHERRKQKAIDRKNKRVKEEWFGVPPRLCKMKGGYK